MIIGIGIDLTEIDRIAGLIERWGDRFTDRVFTPIERAHAFERADPARHLAARFAAKEATLKALAVPRGLTWHEIEVVGGGQQPPRLMLTGRARAAADERGAVRMHLSLTHDRGTAAAVVIAES